MTQFEWGARDSAPDQFPMEIIAANFIGDDGADYVPGGASIAGGWGTPISSAGGGTARPLPRILDILFFSYTENAFYRGKFILSYNKMLSLFQDGYDIVLGGEHRHVTFYYITVGVAPGGVVSIWLQGQQRSIEVFNDHATKVTLPWDVLTKATHITREEYVRKRIHEYVKTPEAIAALQKNGPPLGRWDHYRTRYAWQPEFINLPLLDNRIDTIRYYAGEYESLDYPLDPVTAAATRPVPMRIEFVWKPPQAAKGLLVEIYFNEAEVLHAFEKLGANHQPLKMELRLERVDGKNSFTVSLRNDKEKIEFDHHELKYYTALR